MRIVFMGTPAFAVPTLRAIASRHEVVAVVAQPDRPSGRGQGVVAPATVVAAGELGLAVLQPAKLKSGDFPAAFEALHADVAVVVAYGRILPGRLLAAPKRGCINVHASLLPRWRGAAPIQWSVLAGDEETGVTTMRMAEGLDTGDILLQEATPIGPEETAPELFLRLAAMGADLLVRTLDELDGLQPVPQPGLGVTLAPPLTREQAIVDWSASAAEIARKVRGLAGWPGTTTVFRGEVLKVLRVRVVAGTGLPGAVIRAGVVAAGTDAIELVEVQMPGRRAVRGADWANGSRVVTGERLGG